MCIYSQSIRSANETKLTIVNLPRIPVFGALSQNCDDNSGRGHLTSYIYMDGWYVPCNCKRG